jgi:chromosome segregation ATPase
METHQLLNMGPLEGWIGIVLGAIAILGHAKGFFSSGEKKLAEDLKKTGDDIEDVDDAIVGMQKKLTEHDRRIQFVEGEMKHLPDKDGLHKQQLEITEMRGDIGVIKKSIETTERTARRVEEYLLKRGD